MFLYNNFYSSLSRGIRASFFCFFVYFVFWYADFLKKCTEHQTFFFYYSIDIIAVQGGRLAKCLASRRPAENLNRFSIATRVANSDQPDKGGEINSMRTQIAREKHWDARCGAHGLFGPGRGLLMPAWGASFRNPSPFWLSA